MKHLFMGEEMCNAAGDIGLLPTNGCLVGGKHLASVGIGLGSLRHRETREAVRRWAFLSLRIMFKKATPILGNRKVALNELILEVTVLTLPRVWMTNQLWVSGQRWEEPQ